MTSPPTAGKAKRYACCVQQKGNDRQEDTWAIGSDRFEETRKCDKRAIACQRVANDANRSHSMRCYGAKIYVSAKQQREFRGRVIDPTFAGEREVRRLYRS
jgi:hypothetical protein